MDVPVGLSDAARWCQVAHQQLEDGGLASTVLTNLAANDSSKSRRG